MTHPKAAAWRTRLTACACATRFSAMCRKTADMPKTNLTDDEPGHARL